MDHAGKYRQALEAIDTRDHIVTAISHDLKNPIATVAAAAQLLRRVAASQQAADQAEGLLKGIARIESTVRRMSRMIDGLLDVTRLELNEPLKLERAPMDLVEVVNRMVADHQERAPRHVIQLAGDTSVVGEWDLARLERVVDNLVGNAVKYSPDGGVINVLRAREVEEPDELAILSVHDHGVGIPAADLDRIFERFHRAANVRSITGTGLELATIREIVKLHGGTITVESNEGQREHLHYSGAATQPPSIADRPDLVRPSGRIEQAFAHLRSDIGREDLGGSPFCGRCAGVQSVAGGNPLGQTYEAPTNARGRV